MRCAPAPGTDPSHPQQAPSQRHASIHASYLCAELGLRQVRIGEDALRPDLAQRAPADQLVHRDLKREVLERVR